MYGFIVLLYKSSHFIFDNLNELKQMAKSLGQQVGKEKLARAVNVTNPACCHGHNWNQR